MNITIADVRRHAQERVAIMGFTTLHTVDTHRHHRLVQETALIAAAQGAHLVNVQISLVDAHVSSTSISDASILYLTSKKGELCLHLNLRLL